MDQVKEAKNLALYSEKMRLLKKYLPGKILLKNSKYELLLHFKVLSRFSQLIFFNVTFPKEVITFINNIYIELIRRDIDIDFGIDDDLRMHLYGENYGRNICPCNSKIDCHKTWYTMTNNISFKMGKYFCHTYSNLLEEWWGLNHCDVLQKQGEICHNIFLFDENEEEEGNGFICSKCNRNCCNKCLVNEDDDREEYYCVQCHK